MQFSNGRQHPISEAQSPLRNPTDFLYEGLPPHVQEHFSKTTNITESITRRARLGILDSTLLSISFPKISRTKALLVLCWILILWWGEKYAFSNHIDRCEWKSWEQWDIHAQPHHLILLADPQIVDPHTYPGRPWPLSSLTFRHTDQYMRRAFTTLEHGLTPDTIFFLGDLFDGGREWSTADSKSPDPQWHKYGQKYWLQEYDRFGRMFLEPWRAATAYHKDKLHRKLIASLPGNHDLGLGSGIQASVRKRFHTFFGVGDRIDVIGNHTLVSIDSVSLSAKSQFQTRAEARDSEIWEASATFLSNFQSFRKDAIQRSLRITMSQPENSLLSQSIVETKHDSHEEIWASSASENLADFPTIVLSHVPFYRPPGTACGPLRERWPPAKIGRDFNPDKRDDSNAISIHAGYQYQNVLSEDLSRDIVKKIGDVRHIFSGDDHDYCEVIHKDLPSRKGGVPEITVKSMSWAMGVRKPGFLLVSLWNPLTADTTVTQSRANNPTIQTHLCLLPDQLRILIRYGFLFMITLIILGARAFVTSGPPRRVPALLPPPVSTPTFSEPSANNRSRADSASFVSSANSNDSNGLAVRSSAGRSRSLSPAYGYGFEHGFGSPTQNGQIAAQPPHDSGLSQSRKFHEASLLDVEVENRKPFFKSVGWKGHWKSKTRNRNIVHEFMTSLFHVGSLALLWYSILALTF